MEIIINGRFIARSITGVERVAHELSKALSSIKDTKGSINIVMAVPPNTSENVICTFPISSFRCGLFSGHLWEQIFLPFILPRQILLSPCNTGPILRRRHAIIIHDALFVEHPNSFSFLFRLWYRIVLRINARRARHLITVSNYSLNILEDVGLVPRGKLKVIHLGVDHMFRIKSDDSIFDRLRIRRHSYILAIGSQAPHKNLAMLVSSFAKASVEGAILVLVGGENNRVFQAVEMPETSGIIYTGRLSDEELKSLYMHALAFAFPSLSEGFGLPPLEAMAVGCPVIATTTGSVPEICGDAPIYADPTDPNAWRDAIRRVCADSDLRGRLASAGRIRSSSFRWLKTANELLEILAENNELAESVVDR